MPLNASQPVNLSTERRMISIVSVAQKCCACNNAIGRFSYI